MNEECYCGLVEGGKVLVCHIHYKRLLEDSNFSILQTNNNIDDLEIEYIGNMPIIRGKKMIKTGTPRPAIYCKICKRSWLDFCPEHYNIPNSWSLKYE